MEAQQIKSVIERALVSFVGTTTSDGAAGGTTIVCSDLTGQPDYDGQTVLIAEGSYAGQSRDIDGSTTGGTITVSAFGGQIVSGINFYILTGLPSMAELEDIKGTGWTDENLTTIDANIDALLVDLGDFSAQSNLKSLLAALGIPDVSGKSLYTCLITDRLDDATNGLANIKSLIDTVDGVVDTLETLVGTINDTTTDTLHGKLGTDTELADNSLYDLLGGLAFKTHSLSAMLGALTATDNLKGILGGYTTAANLKAAIDAIDGYVAAITAAGPTNTQLNTAIALITAVTDNLPNSGALTDMIATLNAITAAGPTNTQLNTAIALITAVTDNLPNNGALTDMIATLNAITAAGPTNTQLNTAIALCAQVADGWDAALATILDNFNATRIGDLDELAAANMPADLDTVKGLVDTAESVGPFSYLDTGGEQDVVVDTATTRRRIWLEFSNRNMTQAGTFRIYRNVNGTNYDQWTAQAVTVGANDDRAFDAEFTTNQAWKLTYEEDVDETAARAIPYNVITQVIE